MSAFWFSTFSLPIRSSHSVSYTHLDVYKRQECYLALSIDADEKQVIAVALNQNYVPIVDGRGALCGIITRQSLIHYLENQRNAG